MISSLYDPSISPSAIASAARGGKFSLAECRELFARCRKFRPRSEAAGERVKEAVRALEHRIVEAESREIGEQARALSELCRSAIRSNQRHGKALNEAATAAEKLLVELNSKTEE